MPRNNRLLQGLRGRKILESLNINSVTNFRHPTASEYQDFLGANYQNVPAGQCKATLDNCPSSSGGQIQEVPTPIVSELNMFDTIDLESTVSLSSILMTTSHDFDIDILPFPDHTDIETTERSKSVGETLNNNMLDVHAYSFVRSLSLSDLTHEDSTTFRSIRKVQSAPALTSKDYLTLSVRDSPSILLNCHSNLSDGEYHSSASIFKDSSSETELETEFGDMSEGRKRRHVAEPRLWKRNTAKLQRMKGQEFLGYTRTAGGKFQHNTVRSARQLGDRCKSEFCKKSKLRDHRK